MESMSTRGVALVYGAASGIGLETAINFGRNGALGVVFADINLSLAREPAESSKAHATNPKYRAIAAEFDLRDELSIEAVAALTAKEFGRIDYSVNSAGIAPASTAFINEISVDDFDNCVNTMGRGTMLCIRAVSKIMSQQTPSTATFRNGEPRQAGTGAIVTVGSGMTLFGEPHHMNYTCAKAITDALTKSSSTQLAPFGIRINSVLPSYVDTTVASKDLTPGLRAVIKAMNPPGRLAQAEEIADLIIFLCSPAASYMSGQLLMIDNAWSQRINLGGYGI